MKGIAIGPLDRLGATVVVSDVSSNLAREVRNGREDSVCDDIALDLGEPQFNLVEPGRVRRREVNVDVGTVIGEVADALGLNAPLCTRLLLSSTLRATSVLLLAVGSEFLWCADGKSQLLGRRRRQWEWVVRQVSRGERPCAAPGPSPPCRNPLRPT